MKENEEGQEEEQPGKELGSVGGYDKAGERKRKKIRELR